MINPQRESEIRIFQDCLPNCGNLLKSGCSALTVSWRLTIYSVGVGAVLVSLLVNSKYT